ncbi:MAG: Xaa-Pro peptidase family protein [Candidatus Sumerlaeaceae bacterium]|nr:Xaa-Pro peptidase family protein [Candidatus Sumerlaeaceae bacterium]
MSSLRRPCIEKRLSALRASMESERLDAFLVIDRVNSLYFTGLHCSNSILVVTAEAAVFLTDFRYLEIAQRELTAFEVRPLTQHTANELKTLLRPLKLRRIGFEGSITVQTHARLADAAGRATLVEAGAAVARLRALKDETEVTLIAASQRTNERIMRRVLAAVQPGVTESALAREVRLAQIEAGVGEGFETIVASGPNSSLPHARPGIRRLRNGDFLTLDMGCIRCDYHSDLTRTVVLTKVSPRHREIYEIVREAQERALAVVRAGVACHEVDAAARSFITARGYGEYFGHGLGHGVGLAIHEAPTLNPRSHDVLEPGMIITIEPGIYIPGFGGVRIEDLVVVTAKGYRNLTVLPKRLRVLCA